MWGQLLPISAVEIKQNTVHRLDHHQQGRGKKHHEQGPGPKSHHKIGQNQNIGCGYQGFFKMYLQANAPAPAPVPGIKTNRREQQHQNRKKKIGYMGAL